MNYIKFAKILDDVYEAYIKQQTLETIDPTDNYLKTVVIIKDTVEDFFSTELAQELEPDD